LTKYQSRWYNKLLYEVHNPQHPCYDHNANWGPAIFTQMEEDCKDLEGHKDLEFPGNPFTMEVDKDNEVLEEVPYLEQLNFCTILVQTVATDKKEKRESFIPL
jgi:hypothetical protein